MVFSSTVFICAFLPIVLILYYLIPKKFRNIFLFVASLIFYAWGEPLYVIIMIFSTVFDFFNGIALEKLDKKEKGRKLILALSIIVNIGLLSFFKYSNFVITNINSIGNLAISLLNITMPIGISFYTFQTLSYTIDVYRRKVPVQHNIFSFGMYVSMFPQLIAGPIVRYSDISGQIDNRRENPEQIARGIIRFSVGLAKKVLIANQLGSLWDEICKTGGQVPVLTAWIGAVAFTFQIYFDFSGYSDMAIGLGKMLGFDFPENFRHPYESKSITEFWRRWHITLGTWFREYLYIPLGGNRKGLPRQILNLFIVWFLTGLWHGAGWNFILWGLYFFVFLVIEKLFLLKAFEKLPKFIPHIYTLLTVVFSWVIFACDDISVLGEYVRSLFGANGFSSDMSIYYLSGNAVMLVLAAIFSTHYPTALITKVCQKTNLKPSVQFTIQAVCSLCLIGLSLMFITSDSYNPFLYFRF